MRGKIFGMCRSGMALLVALCMVVGMIPAVLVATAAETPAPDYETLVDMITNGDDVNAIYEAVYAYAKQEGYIDTALDAIDEAIAQLNDIDLSETELDAEDQADAAAQIADTIEVLEAAKALLVEADVLDQATVDAFRAMMTEAEEALDNLIDRLEDEVKALVEQIKEELAALYEEATHGEYTITPDSYYVALGDNTAVSNSYVDLLADEFAELSQAEYNFTNLAENGLLVQDVYDVLDANVAEIEKADFITIGFGSNGFTSFAVDQVSKLIDGESVDLDWSVYVGQEGVSYVEEARQKLVTYLEDAGLTGNYLGIELTELLTVALESYAYSYIGYAYNLPLVVEAIREINADALVVIVGMYNPLDGVVLDMEGTELPVGEYVQNLVNITNAEALLLAMLTGEAKYVAAPEVEVSNTKTVMTTRQFINEYSYYNAVGLNPNQNGHTYITEQILNALTVTVQLGGLLGDADSNGVVDNFDAMLILQYSVDLIADSDLDLSVCDVNGDDCVDNLDAMLVMQYAVGLITVFPAEQ